MYRYRYFLPRFIISLIILLCHSAAVTARVHTVAEVPNVHVADRTKYVSDPDGVLSPSTVERLNSTLADVWKSSTAEPVVVVLGDIDTDDVDGFATELFTRWGIGKKDKDNGVLILVVRDKRKAVIRTGYGAEGVLPDVIAGRILRENMFPRFREGDYDGGVLAATERMASLLTDPEAAEELRSTIPNDSHSGSGIDFDGAELWNFYLTMSLLLGLAALLWVGFTIVLTRKEDDLTRYIRLNKMRDILLFMAFFTIGMGLPAFLWLKAKMNRLRNHPRSCSNCGHAMHKLDEESDNDYLTPAQDTEELLNSIDYDVWLCPQCNTTEVIPYVNRHNHYTVCNNCGARACTFMGAHIVVSPTVARKGKGERIYYCHNCHQQHRVPYEIAKLPPVVVVPSGRGGGFGGGGFSGGSFGGGMTGGGGASGGW